MDKLYFLPSFKVLHYVLILEDLTDFSYLTLL